MLSATQTAPTKATPASPTVQTPPSQQQVVMRINGETIALAELRQIYQLNYALDTFLSRTIDLTPPEQLDQFLNSKLVAQAADRFGFQLPAGEAERARAQWLMAHQKTQVALQETLHANGFTIDDFSTHFHQLYRIDRYLSQQEQLDDRSREELLQELHAQAQISFGAALDEFLATTPTRQQSTQAAIQAKPVAGVLSDSDGAEQATVPFKHFPALSEQELMQSQSTMATGTATSTVTTSTVAATDMTTVATAAQPASAIAVNSEENVPVPIGLAPGNRAPTFSLPSLVTGQPEMHLTDWYGTPIVLSFWTTWCPYCRKQTPVLVAADQLTTTAHIQFLGINVNESATAVAPYVAEHAITYPILLDADGDIANTYAVRGYPTTYFLDAEGHVVDKHVGTLSEAQLAEYLAQFTPKLSAD